jgi:hypothetical protein
MLRKPERKHEGFLMASSPKTCWKKRMNLIFFSSRFFIEPWGFHEKKRKEVRQKEELFLRLV